MKRRVIVAILLAVAVPAAAQDNKGFLTPNTDRTITFGVNWLANRWVKVVANALRQTFEDEARTTVSGTTSFWSGLLRLQVVF